MNEASTRPDLPALADLDWPVLEDQLNSCGYAMTPPLLSPEQCAQVAEMFDDDARFRSTVIMARHAYGEGSYRYFADPLPPLVQTLRESCYPHLAAIANRWAQRLGDRRFPETLDGLIAECAALGQCKPTPLVLRYGPGGYNCLHQDIYGEHVFPLQAAFLLSAPGRDFTGGEFVVTEQRPRMQSRAEVVALSQGEGVIFAVHHRPVRGARGTYRVNLRHGVSRIRSGERYTTGIIFHDGT